MSLAQEYDQYSFTIKTNIGDYTEEYWIIRVVC